MTPFHFGAPSRRLFGIYTPAAPRATRKRAIVLCNPLGQEYLFAHRSLRQLGGMLSAAGIHVLRFDYYGTGDSAGDPSGSTTLKGWESDIEAAMEELMDVAGVPRVSLLGLRLGASLAAAVAVKRRKQLDSFVLWDPVVSGYEYLAERPPTTAGASTPSPTADDWIELFGFVPATPLVTELSTVDLVKLAPAMPPPGLTIVSQTLPTHAALSAALSNIDPAPMRLEIVAGPSAWLEEGHSGAAPIPLPLLRRIAEWLS